MNEQQITQLVEQLINAKMNQSQYSSISRVPKHFHNNNDAPQIPPTSVTNFVPLPSNNSSASNLSGVLSTNNIGVSTPPYNILYPIPVINGYGVGDFSQFNGGVAPFGSMIIFQNSGTPLYQLWVMLEDGLGNPQWSGITLNLTA